ncbi:ATP-dependent DNA helicase PcrA [Moorella thermoacetica]|uniref:DNA 3'-5' helicase n=1 Tax=Neomoorella thermoacetica TaxID=1525 RepID=A0AAC9HIK2_NEOTH|nr:UvrD-helicase domain-containing protein [Moorella thermoacetica]AOQ24559.1 ATP-dependent DNA helicase PcrA [Moorella thermoacetica]TYL12660.1 ATP-dependent DNA helicase PcrA [Moorella thermoacetica]
MAVAAVKLDNFLNPQQIEAVTAPPGKILVLAGPGSGKTATLTHRIAYLLDQGSRPEGILAATFTNKAANELRNRLQNLVGNIAQRIQAGTFHSLGLKILRRHHGALNLPVNFRVTTESEAAKLKLEAMKQCSVDIKDKECVSHINKRISLWKNSLVTPEEAATWPNEREAADVYAAYQELLLQSALVDFDDMLYQTCLLFSKEPAALAQWQFEHVLVDEYQDTNVAQDALMNYLSTTHGSIFAVGDANQSIYGFRGSQIGNILRLQDSPGVRVYKLERNYRSTGVILNAANVLIKNNYENSNLKLWTTNPIGSKITYFRCISATHQANFIAREIKKLNRPFGDYAVLARTNGELKDVESALLRNKIPYQVMGGVNFYERQEIKDIMACLQVAHNPDDDEAFIRMALNFRGIGDSIIANFKDIKKRYKCRSLYEAARALLDKNVGKVRNRKYVVAMMDFVEAIKGQPFSPGLINHIFEASGMKANLEGKEQYARLENIKQLIQLAREFESYEDFFDYVAMLNDSDMRINQHCVKVMTIHAAKGLEFPVVFVIGLNEGQLPHFRALQEQDDEEERRLMYVAMTRAMEKLYLLGYKWTNRKEVMRKSRFLDEIPSKYLHIIKEGTKC